MFRARIFELLLSIYGHLRGGEGGGKSVGHDTFKVFKGHDTFGVEKPWPRDTFGIKSNDTFMK